MKKIFYFNLPAKVFLKAGICKSLIIAFVIVLMACYNNNYCRAQCTMTFNPSGNTYGTGSADLYDKYDADIKAGTATLNNYKGWVNFWIGLSPTSGITYDVTDVKITTYTNTASSSGSHLLDYEEMTVDPFTASRSEIRNDIGSNTEYTFSTAGQQVGFYITSLGSVAISKIESIFNSGPGYFPVGFEEYNMDDNRCIIDGRFDNNPPILKVTYYRIPAAPTGVSASDGTYCDYVYITWNSVGSASSYDVYRGSTNLGNTTSTYYYDYNASTSSTTYKVYAKTDCGTSTSYGSDNGYKKSSCTPPSSASASSSTICSGGSTTLSVSPSSPGSGCTWKWYSGSCGGTYVGSGNNLQVSPTSTTTYYVRAEGSCDPTICKSVTVTVQPSCTPPSSASASPSTIYFGEYTTLSVSPSSPGSGCTWKWYSGSCGGTYVGSGNNLQVSPTSTTTYYVRAEGSCDPTYCENVTVFVDAPTISLNPPDHDFGNININEYSYEFSFTLKNIGTGTAEGNVSLTGSNTDQFEISSGSGSFSLAANATKTINVKFHPNLEGYKSANLLADGSNCNDVSASVSGNGVTAIDDAVLLKYIINIYPNPAFDKLNIEFTDNINKIEELTLYDMLGQAVYLINGKNINTTNFVIDLSEYKSGIYYLNIQTKEDGIIRNKIIIVR